MAISTQEIELHAESLQKFAKEHPQTLRWLLHNFDAIKTALATGIVSTDLSSIEAAITTLQTQLAALQTLVNNLEVDVPDTSALEATVADLQNTVVDLQAQINNLPPPFAMPDGTDGQVLSHGPGGNGDIFFTNLRNVAFIPAQMEDLIPVNEGTSDEAVLPQFALTDDGRVMLLPV